MKRIAEWWNSVQPTSMLVIKVAGSIVLIEFLLMVSFESLNQELRSKLPEYVWLAADPVVLAVLVSPLLYSLLLRQLPLQQVELLRNQAQLCGVNDALEQRVLERTYDMLVAQDELDVINRQLRDAQTQLVQSEKMAAVGMLAAGLAHEINNPIGFVCCNLGSLEQYLEDAFEMLEMYESAEEHMTEEVRARVQHAKRRKDVAFLRKDVPVLMQESRDGIARVKMIIRDLKEFSHADTSCEWQWADLHRGLDSTLGVVWNEIKYHAEVKKEYGDLPEVECLPSQLNQVFMNLLVNAAHAIEHKGVISIRTGVQREEVFIQIADTGKGIVPENRKRIFDPFFTTKPVGKGTGLGLSLSFGIMKKHNGRIEVQSDVGKGSTFTLWLPVRRTVAAE